MPDTNPLQGRELEPIEISDAATLERIFRLRVEAWQTVGIAPELFPNGSWQDEYEDEARHWAVFDGERLLAAARLTFHSHLAEVPNAGVFLDLNFDAAPPLASISRLVVHPAARGLGLSCKFDRVRLQTARDAGCRTILAFTSSDTRLRSLVRQGFMVLSSQKFYNEYTETLGTPLALTLPSGAHIVTPKIKGEDS
ncbi:MAG: GNAT family N-acetyltransferase [Pyrinomonadaceae bacterium MAG19_C2-C3]|nr:GNAT family N-acetyltransferase [Pyrinomonadaceae bacterium MAG19_C2-C3]